MSKVQTSEQRLNPNRKRRLRKKVHVAEFKRNLIAVNIDGVSERNMDAVMDSVFDYVNRMDRKSASFASYNVKIPGRLFICFDLYAHIFNENSCQTVLKTIEDHCDVTFTEVSALDDAHYPAED